MKDETLLKLEEVKEEIRAAARELQANHDSFAACSRLIDAVLMLTAVLEEL